MGTDLRRNAQQRVDHIALFRAELAKLEAEQALVLTPEQRSRLDAHLESVLSNLRQQFGIDVTESAKRASWGMRIASLLGVVALGIAAVLFLYRYWGSLPAIAQVAFLVSAPLLLLAAAGLTFRHGVDLYYTAILSLAAAVAFVVELNAIGGMMNLMSSPHALLIWALFAILVAYAYGLRLLLGAGLALVCVYTGAVWLDFQGWYWGDFVSRSELLIPAAVILYAVPWVMPHRGMHDFSFVYRACGATTGLMGLLVFSTWGHLCCWGVPHQVAEVLCQIVGMALSVAVIFHGFQWGRSGFVNPGAVAFVVFLYVRLHSWWWDWMPKYLFFFLIGLTAIGLLLIFRHLRMHISQKVTS